MAFTKQLPEWHALGVEPPQSLKEGGWKAGVKPPADYFNWLQNKAFKAIEELQLKAGEVKTINGQLPDEKGNIKVNVDTSNLATKEELKAKYSKPLDGIPQSDLASDVQTSLSKADGSAKQTDLEALDKKVNEHSADYVLHPGVATTTNNSNAYAVTLDPAPTSYVNGMGLVLTINADSTGATTINVNGLGAKSIKKASGSDVTNLKNSGIYTLRYNALTGNFILQGEGGSGNAVASDLLSGKTASTDAGDIVGTMPNRGVFNLALGASVPAGYYSGGTAPKGVKTATGTVTINYSFSQGKSFLTVSNLGFVATTANFYDSNFYGSFSKGLDGIWRGVMCNTTLRELYTITVSNVSDGFSIVWSANSAGTLTFNAYG
ncbi:hypothetical protein [Rummeliibacillus stabekisii]|uniref:hypothetical protein n=1 Tax=Rummeliibacillus stabekisii TaxID=241244 RepID=UPI003717651D